MILCLCCTSYASLSCAVGAKRTVADGGPFLSLQRSRLVLFRMGVDQSFFEYSTPQIHPNSERPHGTLISGSSEWGWLGRLFNFEKIEGKCIQTRCTVDPDRCSWRPTIAGTAVETRSSR